MSNKGKTVISCTLYINNILCVRVDLSNPKHLHHKQQLQIVQWVKMEYTSCIPISNPAKLRVERV